MRAEPPAAPGSAGHSVVEGGGPAPAPSGAAPVGEASCAAEAMTSSLQKGGGTIRINRKVPLGAINGGRQL